MKMSRIPMLTVTVLGLILASGLVVAQAADSGGVIRDYQVIVPPPRDHAFREGMKHWERCLRDHGSSQTIYAYDAETGNQSRYAFVVPHSSWAELGQHTAAGKACQDTFDRSVAPHVTGVVSVIRQADPKASYDPDNSPATTALWWVEDYRIKPGKYRQFLGIAHAFAAAAAKTSWQVHFKGYEVIGGGEGSPQFMLVFPNKSWAEAGMKPNPSTRKMMNSVYGKTAAAALSHNLHRLIRDDWGSLWSYDKDLSWLPAKSQ